MHTTATYFPRPIYFTLDLHNIQYVNRHTDYIIWGLRAWPWSQSHVTCQICMVSNGTMVYMLLPGHTNLAFLLCVSEHNYSPHILLPNHAPELTDSVLQWTYTTQYMSLNNTYSDNSVDWLHNTNMIYTMYSMGAGGYHKRTLTLSGYVSLYLPITLHV